MLRINSFVIFASLLTCAGVYAADLDVASSSPITLKGFNPVYDYPGGDPFGLTPPQAAATSLVDGLFLPSRTAVVQADGDDTYTLPYLDIEGIFRDRWNISNIKQPEQLNLVSTLATGSRFLASAASGNGNFAVSDVQPSVVPAGSVDIGANVANPLFGGTSGSCPTNWICAGSPNPGFASYAPTSAQYTGGSQFATSAFSPTIFGGSGTIRQTTSLTWVAGNTYVLNLWAGLPNMEPNGTTPVEKWAPTARLYLTTAAGEQVAAFDIPSPARGTFAANTITFTLPAGSPFAGKPLGVLIFVSAPSLFSANFDITPVALAPVG
jgi:hypothetical protein